MKYIIVISFFLSSLFTSLVSCTKEDFASGNPEVKDTTSHNNSILGGNKMKIKIGNHTFIATLYENATVTAFKSLLPLKITMVELNGNEKYVDLSQPIPSNASKPATIQSGDLMLYGSSTLVLFYKSFSTSYNYTKIGKIDNPSVLAEAVGSGNVEVTFELE